jgi:hypothetical protein
MGLSPEFNMLLGWFHGTWLSKSLLAARETNPWDALAVPAANTRQGFGIAGNSGFSTCS